MIGCKRFVSLVVMIFCSSLLFGADFEQTRKKVLDRANVRDLQLAVQEDVVILRGRAPTLKDKEEAEEVIRNEMSLPVINKIALQKTTRTDEAILMEVGARFRKKASQNYVFNTVTVQSTDGHVILSGQVRDAYFADRAEEAATEVVGVRSVENHIEILGVSGFDERLRAGIYRRLSRDGLLFNYFLGSRPSVHIIVNQSRVTLVGFVNSNVDRVRAASRIREMSGVLSVDNQLKVVKGA